MVRIAALLTSLALWSCSGFAGDSAGYGPGAPTPAKIELSPSLLDFTAIGASTAIDATVLDGSGSPLRTQVDWSTSDPTVATVDSSGVVTAVGKGRCEIKATLGHLTASAHVRVSPIPKGISRLLIVPDETTLTWIGQSLELRAVALDADGGTISEVLADWTTSAPEVVAVDRGGVLEAVAIGEATIRATLLDGSLPTEATVKVRQEAAELRFLDQPSDTVAGAALPTIQIEVADAGGMVVASEISEVHLSALYGEDEVQLASRPTVQGLASFDGLVLERAGEEVVLLARVEGADAARSEAFSVTPSDAVGLSFFSPQERVEVLVPFVVEVGIADVYGNLAADGPEGLVELEVVGLDEDGAVAPPELLGAMEATMTERVAKFELRALEPGHFKLMARMGDELLPAAGPPIEASIVFSTFALGSSHGCGLLSSGMGLCFGSNGAGQLGDQGLPHSTVPVPLSDRRSFANLSAGPRFTCGATKEGAVHCVGDVPGPSPTLPPLPVEEGVLKVVAGGDHLCALTVSGTALCLGANQEGQLGDGTGVDSAAWVVVEGPPFVDIDAGPDFGCALTEEGDVHCWGNNSQGQLGIPTDSPHALAPQQVPFLVLDGISAGDGHACGVREGAVVCWGAGALGQLGDGSTQASSTPRILLPPGEDAFHTVSAGGEHTCATTESGGAYCWGRGSEGQLGSLEAFDEEPHPLPIAVDMPEGERFQSIHAGRQHTCAIASSGRSYCWGDGGDGRLGTGDVESRELPAPVHGTNP